MAEKKHVQHLRSKVVENGKPKLPTQDALMFGEIAVNYAKGYETISIKNNESGITTFSSDDVYTKNKLGDLFTGDTTVTNAINAKQDKLVSGTNIKTINNTSLLGSGNITISGGGGVTVDSELLEDSENPVQNKVITNALAFKKITNPTATTKVGIVSTLSRYYDTNIGNGAVIEGSGDEYHIIQASGDYSHAEGWKTTASDAYSHAEGYFTKASGYCSHAEGYEATASGAYSHAEGNSTIASGDYSHAEGLMTTASGDSSHAEGNDTHAEGYASHAEGESTKASGSSSHAEGSSTTAKGNSSHAEGEETIANEYVSHAEGFSTTANGYASHAEGEETIANGSSSHAEGSSTTASGDYSHAEGVSTITNNRAEHASGQYNVSSVSSTTFGDSGNTLFSVGNGSESNRHNAFEIRQNGDIYITKNNTDIKLQDALGGGGVTVDSELLEDSENPVQNKVITNALNGKADVVAIDGYLHDGAIMPVSKAYTLDGLCITPIVENISGVLNATTNIYFPHFYRESSFEEYEKLEFYKFEFNDGRWGEFGYHYMGIEDNLPSWVIGQITSKIPTATSGTSGLMSAEDKVALDSLNGAITSKADTSAVTQVNNALTAHTADTNVHVTASEKASWNNKSNFSGDYNDLANKPTIPTVPTNVSAFNNDSGYITSNAITGKADTSTVAQINNTLTAHTANTNVHVTSNEKEIWNNKSNFSGDYNDLTNKPTIPSYTAGSGITISNDTISAKIWSGTKAAYEALTTKDSDTIYLIYNE